MHLSVACHSRLDQHVMHRIMAPDERLRTSPITWRMQSLYYNCHCVSLVLVHLRSQLWSDASPGLLMLSLSSQRVGRGNCVYRASYVAHTWLSSTKYCISSDYHVTYVVTVDCCWLGTISIVLACLYLSRIIRDTGKDIELNRKPIYTEVLR